MIMRKRFVLIIMVVLGGFINHTHAQINGLEEICRNGSWVYYSLSAQYEGEVEWTVTGGTGSSTTGSIPASARLQRVQQATE